MQILLANVNFILSNYPDFCTLDGLKLFLRKGVITQEQFDAVTNRG
ncbi:hypothetical protein PQ472_07665 [Lacticaseibacillus pabuli]|uniref:XkdX family protein n=1 Tax=Lacticaseibacillus pabuli TaxID=3025672 RepID=A0ABY7WS45_9LACO|nr:hypothetical protein [Lacticaseibacillus sp. KACC 23028]WDF81801.1 hypothetical protein PQ472_07665 [Lacticaseibacillus sp. KACC 23028]